VKDFSTIAALLNEAVIKSVGFKWEEEQELAFVFLKKRNYALHLFWLYLTLRKHLKYNVIPLELE
jgi:hypothetical protein